MSKKKKPEIKYGIEITKPHSKDMYDHNDMVAKEMKSNIMKAWKALLDKQILNDEESLMECCWECISEDSKLVKLQKGICYSGYGSGYTVQDVNDEFIKELDTIANWQLHEEYAYLCFEALVPRTRFMMVGFGWSKHDYDGRIVSNQEMASPVLEK